jgi:hypothetical protein
MISEDTAAFFRLLFVLIALGALLAIGFALLGRIPLLGKLPGDVTIALPRGSVYLPISSSLLVSILVTAIAYFIVTRSNSKDPR